MSTPNRSQRLELLFKSLKKFYKPVPVATDRSMLELLLFACCYEDARPEAAEEAFAKLQQSYYDWNEVRVTTVAELSEIFGTLPDAAAAATRIKKSLQAMFESRYSFDIDDFRKMNFGKTINELESWGVSKFVVAFFTQNALGGHAIPVDSSSLEILRLFEIISHVEFEKNMAPGLERAIPKARGAEFSSLLHQFAADFRAHPRAQLVQAVFKDAGVSSKKPLPPPPPTPTKKSVKEPEKSKKTGSVSKEAKDGSKKMKAGKKPTSPMQATKAKSPPTPPKKAKKMEPARPAPKKKVVEKPKPKTSPGKITKRKPR